jgi:ATP-binding cassette subfamily C protein
MLATHRRTWGLDDDAVCVVEAGHVDVFVVEVRPGTMEGRTEAGHRRHVMRVEAGEAVVGMGAAFDGLGAELWAVAAGETVLRDLSPDEGTRAQPGEPGQADELLATWTTRLARAASGAAANASGHAPGTASALPEAGEGTEPDRPAVYRALAVRLVRRVGEARTAETGQLAARARHQRRALDDALHALAAVVVPEDAPRRSPSGGDLLLAAAQAVGAAMGVEIVDAPDESLAESEATRSSERLAAIARASGVRLRRVALREDWWTRDNGPLLARTLPPEAASPSDDSDVPPVRPVALVPDAPGRYRCIDPATGADAPLDAALAGRLYPFAYSFYRPFPDGPLAWTDVVRFGLRACRRDLLLVVLVSAAAGLLSTAAPVVTGLLINDVIPGAERPRLVELTAMLLVVTVVASCFEVTRSFALLRVQGRVEADVQAAVWDRLLKLPLSFFRRYTAGDVAQRAMSVSQIQRLLAGPALVSLLGGVFSVFHFALLFVYSPRLAVWAVALSGAALVLVMGGAAVQLQFQRRITALGNRISGLVLQLLTGIAKLRVAGAEATAFTRWAGLFAEKRRLQFRQRRVAHLVSTAVRVVPLVVTLVVFALAAPSVEAGLRSGVEGGGAMRTGDLLAFLAALTAGLSALLSMRAAVTQIFHAVPLYENAQPILHARPETEQGQAAPGRLSGRIEIRHVSFRYDADGPPVLDDVSLDVPAGSFAALVGPSGSGKSTLLRLLLGFETPDAGTVAYDDRDLAGLDVRAVRRQIGVVLQDGALVPGDVLTNILGSTRATADDAWHAAEQAGLADDIRAMPMGLHTVVGQGASTLSGGQIQRLLIARAIVHRPRLLFFDEATSALDNRTQAQVTRSLDCLRATRVVVAHRLSTVRHADCIYVLDAGRIVESGTYDALIGAGGLFADLAARQEA